jgi:hypothetical protein
VPRFCFSENVRLGQARLLLIARTGSYKPLIMSLTSYNFLKGM